MTHLFASTPRDARPVSDQLLERLSAIPVANIADGMGRLGMMSSEIRPVHPSSRLCGRAFTIWTRAGDNKVVHEALDHVRPGDVVVINGEGDTSRALIGELIAARAKLRGAVAFVVDGAVRDAPGLAAYGVPTFARAVTGAGPYKSGPGAHSVPIAMGGVVVNPGDVVAGDDDGVVVIPSEHASAAADAAAAKQASEESVRTQLEASLDGLR